MEAIKLRNILRIPEVLEHDWNFELRCNGEGVYDYKDHKGKLVLIHEQNGTGSGYEPVNLEEVMIAGNFLDLPVVSESLGDDLADVEIIQIKKADNVRYALNLKFNVRS